jgi:uncharacterized damage-inducible protein DinB
MSVLESCIDKYEQGVVQLTRRIRDMTADQLRARPVSGRWSTLEVVCHIVDSDLMYADRMKRVIAEDEPTLVYAHEDLWVERLHCHERDVEEELSLLEQARRQMARILRRLPPEAFERTGIHTRAGQLTLLELLQNVTRHLDHHARFIDEKRAALGLGVVE